MMDPTKIPDDIKQRYDQAIKLHTKNDDSLVARTILDELLKLYPNHPVLLNSLGNTYLEVDAEKAEKCFLKSLKALPDFSAAQSNLSDLYSRMGRFDEAAEYARRAIKTGSKNPYVWNTMGLYYARLEKIEIALEYFMAAYSFDNTFYVAAYNIACCMVRQHNLDSAYEHLEIAFYASPRFLRLAETDAELEPIKKSKRFLELFRVAEQKHNQITTP